MSKPQKITNKAQRVSSRSDLLKLLCEAAELEHGIACSYLYAGFSLKREISEGGMSWQEQQTVRRWASQIYFIASQEMLHLALVWNLTTAIGGTPYYLRPNFPQASKYYPLNAALALEPFGPSSLRRFIQYERPQILKPERDLKSLLTEPGEDAAEIEFTSIGELYALIESGFRGASEKELFIGSADQQMTPALIHFPEYCRSDRPSISRQSDSDHHAPGRGHPHRSRRFALWCIRRHAQGIVGLQNRAARPFAPGPTRHGESLRRGFLGAGLWRQRQRHR